jgi:hypothetical protein
MFPGRTLLPHFSRIEKLRVRRKEEIKKKILERLLFDPPLPFLP